MIGAAGRRWAFARLTVALAVMLVAVLPHATLAASSGFVMSHAASAPAAHDAGSGHSHHASAHHDTAQGAAATRHDPAPARDKASPAMPACCILGCGLIAPTPDVRAATPAPTWLIRAAVPALDTAGRTTEPAERPPRLRPALIRAT